MWLRHKAMASNVKWIIHDILIEMENWSFIGASVLKMAGTLTNVVQLFPHDTMNLKLVNS